MKRCTKNPNFNTELLAPAGSFEAARAAVNAGADAIYMGGPLFSARAFAESSRDGQLKMGAGTAGPDMLLQAIEFCHLRGVRVYMTLNTLIKEREFCELEDYLRPYVAHRLDGVIVQDLGVMKFIRETYPQLELHISTQAVITGPRYAKRLKELGAVRVVLARETTLADIRRIREEADVEIEAFAHGALCYSYSGQCLMSSFIGGRSGNRGRCAGTCRLPFTALDADGRPCSAKNEQYLLSMKDLNCLERLKEMILAGVYSFKIEGRMKSPVYVAAVISVYRKYLDQAMRELSEGSGAERLLIDPEDDRMLSEVFERGGHTDGYLDGKNGREMLTLTEKQKLRTRDEAVIDALTKAYLENDRKLPVALYAAFREGEVPSLTLTRLSADGMPTEQSVTVYGEQPVTRAEKRAASREDVENKLARFGETDFVLEEMTVAMEGALFLPVKVLNELRRQAAEALKQMILGKEPDDEGNGDN